MVQAGQNLTRFNQWRQEMTEEIKAGRVEGEGLRQFVVNDRHSSPWTYAPRVGEVVHLYRNMPPEAK
eukprot:12063961-Prorocentrum_lima.AAC.1